MKLQELMTPDPERLRVDHPLSEAGRRMVQLGIRHIPVVDDLGKLVGLLTDFDVFRRGAFLEGADPDRHAGWIAYDKDDDDLFCGDVMARAEVTLNPELATDVALAELHRSDQDALVVVDARYHPIGVLSEHDALSLALVELDPSQPASMLASSPVESIEVTETAAAAFERLTEHGFRHLVVTQGGELFGVVSIRDLVADDAPRRSNLRLRDVLRSTAPYSTRVDATIGEVIRTMKTHKIGCMPVVDNHRRPIGIITRRDVIGRLIESPES